MITRPLQAWNRFWFAPISARPLGTFRVVYGVLAIVNLLLLTVDLDYWLTDQGLFRGTEAAEVAGPMRFSFLNQIHDPITVRLVLAATLAAAVGLTVGWRTRVMCIIYYLGLLSIHHRNVATASGADVLFQTMAFYLLLSPCGAAYSLDALRAARKRGGTLAEPLIVPWAQRLMQIQIGVLYTSTSILKAAGPTWLNGTALHFVFCNLEVGRFDLGFLAGYPLLVNLLTYVGLATELCLAFLLWFRAARPWVIPAGLMLHAGILFVVNIPLFGELTTAAYLVFLGSDEWEWLRTHLNPYAWALRRFQRSAPGRPALSTDPTPLTAISKAIEATPRSGHFGRLERPRRRAGRA